MEMSTKRGVRAAALLATGTLLLAGCASGAPEGEGSEPAAAGSGDTLIVYTNSNSDGRGEWITEKAADAGIDIEIVGLGGADLTNRIIAEKNNPVGDVVFGLNNMFFEQLKAEEAITAYEPEWGAERFPPTRVTRPTAPSGRSSSRPSSRSTTRTRQRRPLRRGGPLDREGSTPARYEVNPALGQATPQLVLARHPRGHLDEDGDLGVSDEGWALVEACSPTAGRRLKAPTSTPASRVTRSTTACLPSSGIAARDEEYGTKTGMIVPSDYGVPYVTEQIAQRSTAPTTRPRRRSSSTGSAAPRCRASSPLSSTRCPSTRGCGRAGQPRGRRADGHPRPPGHRLRAS